MVLGICFKKKKRSHSYKTGMTEGGRLWKLGSEHGLSVILSLIRICLKFSYVKKKKKRNLVLPVSGRSFSLPVAGEAESEP